MEMQTGYALAQAAMNRPQSTAAKESTDLDLIESITAGDKLAMQVLYARHNVKVYRFVLRLVGDTCKAEDVVSEVFFEVWRQADRFEGRCQAATWILAIARFKAMSLLRQRHEETLDDGVADTIADLADNPEVVVQKKDDGALLRSCIEQLSPEHRAVIDLVYYHEMSVGEVAKILGAPRNTVKTRMFYARKRISELFLLASGQSRYQA
jgi:RNA polymerase sigma-70 factor (ECF subfamily)